MSARQPLSPRLALQIALVALGSGPALAEVITVGLTPGPRTRYDELTVFVYTRLYPQGNTVETTAGLLVVGDNDRTRGSPSDAARADARAIAERCAPRQ